MRLLCTSLSVIFLYRFIMFVKEQKRVGVKVQNDLLGTCYLILCIALLKEEILRD